MYDDTIGQESIDEDTDMTKEIFVKTGTTVDKVRDLPYGLESADQEGELVCTTMTVIIAASIAIILTTCLLCLYFSRSSKHQDDHHADIQSQPSFRTSTTVYHYKLAFRPSSRQSRITKYSDKTLQSLRSSLKD